jgi:copper chaperone
MTLTLSIPDMSCGHCKAAVEAALAPARVEVDLATRRARAEGIAPEAAVAALAAAGFPAEVVPDQP